MKKRIYGLETEYALTLVKPDGSLSCLSDDLSRYIDYFRTYSRIEFWTNGSRVYVDTGYHPEYCTAECVSLLDLIAQDKAGEKILNRIFTEAVEDIEHKYAQKIMVFKNNCDYFFTGEIIDVRNVTFGCHENFLSDIKLDHERIAKVFVPFLVVRQIVAGSGWVANPFYQSQGSLRYCISQRSRFIQEVVGESTTSRGSPRAIFCKARWEEPHADRGRYRRLHLLLGDSNMSEVQVYLKMGLIGILLEMIEEGFPFADLVSKYTLKNPVEALHSVMRDLTCKNPLIELANGRFISAIDLFWVYIDAIRRYDNSYGLNEESANVLRMAIDILQRLERRQVDPETLMEIDSQGLDEELDWLIKKSLLEEALKGSDCHWNNFYERDFNLYKQIRAKDLKYHDISDQGIYNFSFAEPDLPPSEIRSFNARTPRMVEKERIKNMEESPPQDNRAKIRGEFLKFLKEKQYKDLCSVEWDRISLFFTTNSYGQYGESHVIKSKVINLDDPFMTESDQADYWKLALSQGIRP